MSKFCILVIWYQKQDHMLNFEAHVLLHLSGSKFICTQVDFKGHHGPLVVFGLIQSVTFSGCTWDKKHNKACLVYPYIIWDVKPLTTWCITWWWKYSHPGVWGKCRQGGQNVCVGWYALSSYITDKWT